MLLFSLLSFIVVGSINAMDGITNFDNGTDMRLEGNNPGRCKRYPLHEAVDRGDVEQLQLLLGQPGAKVDAMGYHPETPLYCAADSSCADKKRSWILLIAF